MEPARLHGKDALPNGRDPGEELLSLTREVEVLRERELTAICYIREKVNQLLALMGTFPLKPEELDDATLLSLDPIGIVSDSFAQVLEHIHTTNSKLVLAHREIQAIFDSAGAGILVLDSKMRVQAYNAKLGEMFLGVRADVIGQTCNKVICRHDVQSPSCAFGQVLATNGTTVQSEFIWHDRHFSVTGTPILNAGGEISQVVIVYTDITERQRAEEALKASEERYRLLVENQSDLMVKVDPKGRLLFVSPSSCAMFGKSEADLVGRKFFTLLHEDDVKPTLALIKSLAAPPHACYHELRVSTGSGWRWLGWSYKAVLDERDRVDAIVGIGRDITERKAAQEEIQQLAYYDTLTGLPNRSLLKDRLNQTLAQANRDKRQVGVMFLDLDRFKGINDTLGHAIGDKLLKKIAERLTECTRKSDTVARLGGDEFVVLLTAITPEEDGAAVAQKILDALSLPVVLDNHEIFTTVSIGIAVYPVDGEDVDTLLKHADIAMYQAKDQGRCTYQFFSQEMNAKAVERLVLENSLRRALEREEFFLHYQPLFDVKSGRIVSCEALLRWRHPDLGLFSPSKFVPLAEETGLILPIGEWVLRTACRQNKLWQEAGFSPIRVAVNLSGRQFAQATLIGTIAGILAETGLAPGFLEVELTESTIMKNAEEARKTLHALKNMGVHLTIDDFGTGYSSLSYLKLFPIDRLKIAQSFVRDITTDQDDAAIAEAIIAMARTLKLSVVAEGVERLEQLEFLRARHCTEMQGFYLGRPVPAVEFPLFFDADVVTRGKVRAAKHGMPGDACRKEGERA